MPDALGLIGFSRLYHVPPQFLFAALMADLQHQPLPSLTSWTEQSGIDALVAEQDALIASLRRQLDDALLDNAALIEQLRDIKRIAESHGSAGKDPPSEPRAARG